MTIPTVEVRRRLFLLAEQNAKKVLKPGDRIRVTGDVRALGRALDRLEVRQKRILAWHRGHAQRQASGLQS